MREVGCAIARVRDGLSLMSFAGPKEKGVAQTVARELNQACQKLRAAAATAAAAAAPARTPEAFPSLQSLRKVIAEEVKAAMVGASKGAAPGAPGLPRAPRAPSAATWAAVAGSGVPKKVVPARLGREVLVKAREAPAELAKRTPQEVV